MKFLVFVFFSGIVAFNAYAALPMVGQPVQLQLIIDTEHKDYPIPLPPGRWTVAAVQTNDAGDYYPGFATIARVVPDTYINISLIQNEGNLLSGLIFIRAKINTSVNNRDFNFCIDKEISHYFNTYGDTRIINRCLEVKPLSLSSRSNEKIITPTLDWLEKVNLSYSSDMIGFQYSDYDRSGRLIEFSYYVNPSSWGFQSSTGSSSIWSKNLINRDERRSRFVTAFTAYAQNYSISLHGALDGQSSNAAISLIPFSFEPNNNSSNQQNTVKSKGAGADPQIEKLKATCQSIGFKLGTSGMVDCVKELMAR